MPTLEIHLRGPLLVAGDASELGADLATARRWDGERKRFIPYIPATALRGAVRLQLEALLRGAGQSAVGPYPLDPETRAQNLNDPVARLFGYSGPKDERVGSLQGKLRFGDALPVDPDRAADALRVRPGLEIDDETFSAADRKLFFREVADVGTDLVFQAPLDLRDVGEKDADYLRAAVESTDALGAGKSKGGGAIEIRWLEDEKKAGAVVQGEPAGRARLVITLREPAHFGDGGPLGNHHATRTYIPGATIRGAIAWTLLNHQKTTAEEAAFKALFLEPSAASFGDALPVDSPDGEPVILAATRREERGEDHAVDDVLVRELSRERIGRLLASRGSALVLRGDDGDRRFDPVQEARPVRGLIKTTRTRVSIDRQTGASADGKLFTIEQIEPVMAEGQPARFVSWIEGIPEAGAALLKKLQGLPVGLGAGRNHGLGQALLELRFEKSIPDDDAVKRVRVLSGAIDRETKSLASRVGLKALDLSPKALYLTLVAQSDYVPTSEKDRHPLAELGPGEPLRKSQPVRCFLRAGAAGGFDERPDRSGPLKDLLPAIGAGSVFVYEIENEALAGIAEALAVLRRGVGRRVECGCGRFSLHSGTGLEGANR